MIAHIPQGGNSLGIDVIQRDSDAMMVGYLNAFYFYSLTALAAIPLILLVRTASNGDVP